MFRRVVSAGGLLTAGLALLLPAAAARADDGCCGCAPCGPFAFFRRCPPLSGTHAAASSPTASFAAKLHCRPPYCPPYCDPTFGFYPTAWRAWPVLFVDAGCAFPLPPAAPGGAAAPGGTGTPPAGGAPPVMPPASDEARRNGGAAPLVRTAGGLPGLSGASGR